MRGISGCPVNPPFDVVGNAGLAPRMWVAQLPCASLYFVEGLNPPSLIRHLRTIHSQLFFPFDLHHFGIVDNDLHRSKPNSFQRMKDCLLDFLVYVRSLRL